MPNPFPGMNPFLEKPSFWEGVHNTMIAEIYRAIAHQLPEGYAAKWGTRCYVMDNDALLDTIIPDNTVRISGSIRMLTFPLARRGATVEPSFARTASDATAVLSPPTAIAIQYPLEVKEGFLQIVDADSLKRVVTVVELLSPSNKARGSAGRVAYKEKQSELIESDTNLLEIDLLRAGAHTIAAPLEDMQLAGTWDYAVSLHRSQNRYHYPFWLCRLRDPLPVVPIPLDGDAPDVPLDLQAVLNSCYDAYNFDSQLHYDNPIVPPLNDEDTEWADGLLRRQDYPIGDSAE